MASVAEEGSECTGGGRVAATKGGMLEMEEEEGLPTDDDDCALVCGRISLPLWFPKSPAVSAGLTSVSSFLITATISGRRWGSVTSMKRTRSHMAGLRPKEAGISNLKNESAA